MIWRLAARATRLLPPELAHIAAVQALRYKIGPKPHLPELPVTVAGLKFSNPLGLAAGFDKNAACPEGALALGFGHVEVGTITPHPQPGNPRPRVFRLREDDAVINRYGFNSLGMEAVAANLARQEDTFRPVSSHRAGIIGINVGANKTSASPTQDYRVAVARLAPFADYITLNISSPNTPGLRNLQSEDNLRQLIAAGRDGLAEAGCSLPLFVKLSPDLDADAIAAIAEVAVGEKIDGLIATNTTVVRPVSLRSSNAVEGGGLSGAPLFEIATIVLAELAGHLSKIDTSSGSLENSRSNTPPPALIAAGGVASGWQAYAKILVGASLVQLYSGLALQGPNLPGSVVRELAALIKADGCHSIEQAKGQIPDAEKAIQHALHLAKTV